MKAILAGKRRAIAGHRDRKSIPHRGEAQDEIARRLSMFSVR
ncbi:MAG: hypothetical protein R3F11_21080 [Verrucomicrobiales bacterium]